MPTDEESGWVEPDILVNGRALTFAECMAVRVAISSFRLSLTAQSFREGLGDAMVRGYDRHLARVEQTMMSPTTKSAFHVHLDGCPQCRDHPLDLCATGTQLLRAAVDASDRP